MSAGMTKPWLDATEKVLAHVPVQTGVYEIRRGDEVLDIAYAGSRENFGLRSAIGRAVGEWPDDSVQIRYEQHVQYQSRYLEVVLNHKAHHGGELPFPVANREPHVRGRLSPDSLKTHGESA